MDTFLKETVLFGGDYNPDQWSREVIERDMALFQEAHINILTLPVFAWTKLEPEEGKYEFGWLDEILTLLEQNGFHYFLATPTAAQPAWMSKKYPEVHLVDSTGRRKVHGSRTLFCPNSDIYRERAARIAKEMAERYAERKGLAGWHIANEYGHYCYCENCRRKFTGWLAKRYRTLAELNRRWNTAFWNRTFTDFDEIQVPSERNDDAVCNPVAMLSYQRFMTDSTIECFENEAKILKQMTPELPVFTNISGNVKALDQHKMLTAMDIAGWDNYPDPDAPASLSALYHDIMRGLKDGQSYYVMEQSPNQQNWQPYNKVKRPGEIRELAYQGLAHGADSALYFQMRQSAAGVEKFHGALISHSGRTDTKVFQEMKQFGAELQGLGSRLVGATTKSEVGFILDWNNWWALENNSGPTRDMDYLAELHRYYAALYRRNLAVDMVKPDADLTRYRVIFAPLLYMIEEDRAERIRDFVYNGGTLVSTYLTGYADEDDRCVYGAYPGPFREVFGLWVEETDALFPAEKNRICLTGAFAGDGGFQELPDEFSCDFLCDRIHCEGAEILGRYGEDFYAGEPCFTLNRFGKGRAYYIGTRPEAVFLDALVERLEKESGIAARFSVQGKVEVTEREKNGEKTIFVICHDTEGGKLDLKQETLTDLLTNRKLTGIVNLKNREVLILA